MALLASFPLRAQVLPLVRCVLDGPVISSPGVREITVDIKKG